MTLGSSARRVAYVTFQRRGAHDAGDVHVDAFVDGLRRRGWDVELVAPGTAAGAARRLGAAARATVRLAGRLRSLHHLHLRMHPAAAPLAVLARLLGTPVLVEVNGVAADYDVAHPGGLVRRGLVRATLATQLRIASAVVTVTGGLAERLRGAGVASERLHVIPNGADADRFRPGLDAPPDVPARYVLYFGSLSPWQGVDDCVTAATHDGWPADVALVIVGDGAARADVERRAGAAGERIVVLGPRASSEVPRYVANAIATLAVKSYHDAIAGQSPLKVYESLAAGVPVIGTRMNGMEVVDDHGAGILLDRPSPAAIAAAVSQLASDPGLVATMGGAGRAAVVLGATWDNRVSQLEGVVARLR